VLLQVIAPKRAQAYLLGTDCDQPGWRFFAVPRLALTDRFVATCKCPKGESQIDYFDDRTPGLALRVTQQRHKAWCFIFTAPGNGKRARETFATYPATGLALARTRAREARALVEAGEDPRAVFNAQAAGAMTATALIESFLEKHARPNLRTAAEIERRLFLSGCGATEMTLERSCVTVAPSAQRRAFCLWLTAMAARRPSAADVLPITDPAVLSEVKLFVGLK
jgi:hypothetical protein